VYIVFILQCQNVQQQQKMPNFTKRAETRVIAILGYPMKHYCLDDCIERKQSLDTRFYPAIITFVVQ
jgi:hypothetical protein